MKAIFDLTLADLMSTQVSVVTPDAVLDDIARQMAAEGISCLIVMADNRPVGIVTERDLLRHYLVGLNDRRRVEEIMSAPVLTVAPDTDFQNGYALLGKRNIRHLVVAAANGEMLGIVSESNFRSHLNLDIFCEIKDIASVMDHDLLQLDPDVPLLAALEEMHKSGGDYVLFVEQAKAIGIITERDIPKLWSRHIDPRRVQAREVMSTPVQFLFLQHSVAEMLTIMGQKRIRHMAIVDGNNNVLGVISQHRLLEHLGLDMIADVWRQHRSAEAEKRQLEMQMQLAFEATDQGAWEYDHAHQLNLWSPALCELFSYAYADAPKTLQDWLSLIHDDDLSRVVNAVEEVVEGRRDLYEAEYRMLDGLGIWRWVHARGRIVSRDAANQPLRTLGIMMDITGRKLQQRRFEENRILLNAILDSTADGILVIGDKGQVLKANRRFQAIWGIPDDLLNTGQDRLLLEFVMDQLEDPDAFAEEVRRLYNSCIENYARLTFKDGRVFERYTRPLSEYDSSARIWSFRDITAAVQSETRLKISEQQLRATLELSPNVAVQWYNRGGEVVYWNKASEIVYGWTAEDALGKTLDQLIFTQDEAKAFTALLANVVSTGNCIGPQEFTGHHRDGSLRIVISTIFAIPDAGQQSVFVCMDVDITQGKLAEDELRLSRQRLSLALQSGNDGLWDWNLENNEVYFSPRWKSMLGYQVHELEDVFDTWLRLLHPDDRQATLDQVGDYLAGHSDNYANEFRMRHKNGGWVHLLARGCLAVDENGQTLSPRRMIGTHIDITERKAMETALREREALYSAVVNQAAYGIVLFDLQTLCFIECNAAAHENLGYGREEFLQLTLPDIQAELNQQQIYARVQAIPSGRSASFITRHRHKDGSIQDTHVSNRVVDIGNQHYLMAIWRNITEERRMAIALQKSEVRFRKLFEESALATLLFENDRFIDCNRSALAMLRMDSPQQLINKFPGDISPEFQPDGQRSADKVLGFLTKASEQGSQRFEWQHIRADGECFLCEVLLTSIESLGRNLVHVVWRDMTEQKALERELLDAKGLAEAASQAKSEFLANMSHEIRTPLNAIIGLTELCQDLPLSPQPKDYLEKIQHASKALLGIVNDVLDFSKIEAGKIDSEAREFTIESLLLEITEIFTVPMQRKQLKFVKSISNGLPNRVFGDEQHILQVLNNLVSNAVKFTEQGEICVTLDGGQQRNGNWRLSFSVSDSGIGMSPVEIGQLFQPFTQADASISRRFGGTGLGLAICKRLVALMDGEITVTSQPGCGSTFTFSVEVKAVKSRQTERYDPRMFSFKEMAVSLRGAQILLVEDNALNQLVAKGFLERAGLRVTVANHGVEALEWLQKETFAAVLMDLQMPVMDGFETARIIRSLPEGNTLPIIAMTAAVSEHDRKACINAGINDHVAKPINPQQLLEALLRCVEAVHCRSDEPDFDFGNILQMLGGDKEQLMQILESFVQDYIGEFAEVADQVQQGNIAVAEKNLHQLKGVVGNLGMVAWHRISEQLDSELKAGSFQQSTLSAWQTVGRRSLTGLEKLINDYKLTRHEDTKQ